MKDQRNLILAIALSVAIMLGFEFLFPKPPAPPPEPPQQQATQPDGSPAPATGSHVPTPGPVAGAPPGSTTPPAGAKSRTEILQGRPSVRINTPALHGSINLKGGQIDDLTLANFHETPDKSSPEIVLLSPVGTAQPYFVEIGWVPSSGATGVALPNADTMWTAASPGPLTPESPVTLTWDNGQGLRFVRTYQIDRNYMFQITQKIENTGSAPVSLHPYALISRHGLPKTDGLYILHEGPMGVLQGRLKEFSYGNIDDAPKVGNAHKITDTTKGGWLGITDKYWLTALIPDQQIQVTGSFSRPDGIQRYQVDYIADPVTVQPGGTAEFGSRVFAGAKRVALMDEYADNLGIEKFDLAIDFGWFYFLTKPFFYLLTFLYEALGNFGLAILAITVLVKLLFFPLANKSYKSMSKMKALQPEVKKLQERFGDDRVRMQQEMMALYKKAKVNPVSGCLPIVIQIPVFFALYKVLYVALEMRHAPFYGWIHDLSAADPTNLFTLFGLIPWTPPHLFHLGVWPIIMGITMYLQQKLNPQPADPIQAKMFMILPVVFTFMLGSFPAGLVIYWSWSNVLSILQQWVIMRRMGVKV
jgi:YidC/Oxa1 family membrane protein insertase